MREGRGFLFQGLISSLAHAYIHHLLCSSLLPLRLSLSFSFPRRRLLGSRSPTLPFIQPTLVQLFLSSLVSPCAFPPSSRRPPSRLPRSLRRRSLALEATTSPASTVGPAAIPAASSLSEKLSLSLLSRHDHLGLVRYPSGTPHRPEYVQPARRLRPRSLRPARAHASFHFALLDIS